MKTSKQQRIFSLFLALCLLCTLLSGISLTAFAADTGHTVTFSVPEGVTAPEPLTDTSVTLPTAATPNGKYRFAGWSTTQGTVAESAILTGDYTPKADITLYAVYSLSSGTDGYIKVTEAPESWAGQYLIVSETQKIAFDGTGNYASINYKPVSISNNSIALSDELDSMLVTIAPKNGNYTIKLPNNKYMGFTGADSNNINSNASNQYENTFTWREDGTVLIQNAEATNTNTSNKINNFVYNCAKSSDRFAYYKQSTTEKNVFYPSLYKKSTAGVTYTTAPEACDHEGKTSVDTKPTCTEPGYTTYTCRTCTLVWTADPTDALGHDLVADTESEPVGDSYRRFACTRCDYAENRYQITFSICGEAGESQTMTDVEGMELPKAEDVPEIDGYTFSGWTTTALAEPSADAVILNGHYTPTADLTLYAAYYYTEANDGSGNYVKVTVGDKIVNSGKYLIVNEAKAVVLNGASSAVTEKGNFLSGITVSDGIIAQSTDLDNAAVTVEPISGTEYYALILKDGKYLGHTGTGAGITTKASEPYPIAITFSAENGITVSDANAMNCILRYNSKENSEVFKFYASTDAAYLPVSLYYKDGSGVTPYYITELTDCDHANAKSDPEHIEATCTAAGFNHFTCPDCGFEWDEIILNEDETVAEPALGHAFEGVAATCNNDGTHTRTCTRCHQPVTENCKGNYDKETHLCTLCEYPQPYVTVTFNDLGTLTEERVYDSVTLPEGMGIDGYDFAGWTATPLDEETTDRPEMVNSKWLPKEDTTLYAVYVRTELLTEGTGDYIKIQSNDELTEGKYLIVAEDKGFVFNGELDEPYVKGNYSSVSVLENTIKASYFKDRAAVTIAPIEGSDYFSLQSSNGAFLGSTGSGNKINHNKTNPYPTAISITDGIAVMNETVVKENAEGVDVVYTLCYNAYYSSDRFAFYDLSGKNVQKSDISLFKKDGECAYYYLTNFATELKIDSAKLILNGKIDVEYAAQVPAGYQDVYMVFAMNGTETRVDDNGSHTFVFKGINPQCMGDNISATLHATVGDKEYTDTVDNYSIREYCVNQMNNNPKDTELCTLLSDMLVYGAAAQTYMSYKTDNLVTKDLTLSPSGFEALSGLAPAFTGAVSSEVYWKAAGLTLTDSVAMNFTFYAASVEGLSVEVQIGGRTETISDFTKVDGKEDIYRVSFAGISATEFGKTVTATVKRGNTPVSNALSYSVNAYICAKQADSNANLAALVQALYNYGAAAEEYAK